MVNELGPWRTWAILKQAAEIYGRHFWKFLLLSTALWGHLCGYLLIIRLPGMDKPFNAMLNDMPLVPHLWLIGVMLVFVYPVLAGAIIHAVASNCTTGQMSLKNSLKSSFQRAWSLTSAHLIVGAIAMAILGLSVLGSMIIWQAQFHLVGFFLAVIAMGVGLVLAFKVLTVWAFAVHGVIIEGRNPFNTLGASEDLTWGSRWRVFGVTVLLVGIISQVPNFQGILPLWLQMSLSSIAAPFATIVTTLLYFDLRVRKDGLTPEQLTLEIAVHDTNREDNMGMPDGLYSRS